MNCESLENITIGKTVQVIKDFAFRNCRALTNITLPDSLEKINNYIFSRLYLY